MKYVLLLQICSALLQLCYPSVEIKPAYNSYYQCGIAGYQTSIKMFQQLGYAHINTNKINIRFSCKQLDEA